MAIRSDSYGSVAEITALTRHMLRGESAFNSTTSPSATELETFIDRVSGAVNVAMANRGLTTPVTNTTAVLDVDGFVVGKVCEVVELVIRGAGNRAKEGTSRFTPLSGLSKDAKEFVDNHSLGWIRLGVSESYRMSDGLVFTGQTVQKDRADPDDTTLEQPKFGRGKFDNPTAGVEE